MDPVRNLSASPVWTTLSWLEGREEEEQPWKEQLSLWRLSHLEDWSGQEAGSDTSHTLQVPVINVSYHQLSLSVIRRCQLTFYYRQPGSW